MGGRTLRARAWIAAGTLVPALLLCADPPRPSAGPVQAAPESAAEVPGPVFPPPPAAARLGYQGEIRGNEDFRGGRSLLARLGDLIVGGQTPVTLTRPHGVGLGPGSLFVADAEAGLVHVYRLAEGTWSRLPEQGRLGMPVDAAAGPDGTILVTDAEAAEVVAFSGDGRRLFTCEGPFVRPAGIAYDPARDRYLVADPGAHHLVALSAAGKRLGQFGVRGESPGAFNFPLDVCVLADGSLLVLDAMNFRIQRLEPDGTPREGFGRHGDRPGYLARPRGLACDEAGRCYVTDALQDNFQIFDGQGNLLLVVGRRGDGAGEFQMPAGIAVDRAGRIFVADAYNRRVQIFLPLPAPGKEP